MKLTNDTNFNSKQLKAFVRRVAEVEYFTPKEIAKLKVKAYYRRRSHCWQDEYVTGYAYYGYPSIRLGFVKGVMPDKVQMAKTTAHELAHTQNVRHGSAMRNNRYGWKDGWRETWAWAEQLPLTMNVLPPEPTKDRKVLAKLVHCLKMVVVWERKVRLAKTKKQKWEKRTKYYEKQMKMAAEQPEAKPAETST